MALGTAALVVGAAPGMVVAAAAAGASTPSSPPPVTVVTQGAENHNGDIFITPTGGQGSYANGPEIVDNHGKVEWFHAVPAGQMATDFRTQRYHGRPVLTWWQGTGFGGLSSGSDYIYNDRYQQIAVVKAGNGYSADGHEFLITPQSTALIEAFATKTVNLTSIGGPPDQMVIDGIVQEVNIATGRVIFQWESVGNVPFSDSEVPLPASASTPWDWFHMNAVHLDTDGNLLIGARHTWTTYKLNRSTGAIIWELGGKQSSFTEQAAPGQVLDGANKIFAWQHDPEAVGHDKYTWFDNESSSIPLLPYSRAVTVKLDLRSHVATLLASDAQPEGLSAPAQGNAQTTTNSDLFVGWGALPYFSEFDRFGHLLFNAEFPTGVNSYRSYRLPWRADHRSPR
ncbi:MAG: arylsulfotransferase family protein [Actinomycetota bacterium]|nr:arylsulfotransferase family protein [Actinomycetota bacterium]